MKTGIELIAEERQRQINVEGYDVTKDVANYGGGQLVGAAMCYAANAVNKERGKVFLKAEVVDYVDETVFYDAWPWDEKYDKREKHDQMRSLVIAGALIASEIDRIQKSTDDGANS